MNTIDFINQGGIQYLENHKKQECFIRVMGNHGETFEGMFLGYSQYTAGYNLSADGFLPDYPMIKIIIIAKLPDRLAPIWINLAIIDDINDIIFK